MVETIKNDLIAPGDDYSIYKNGIFLAGDGARDLTIKDDGTYKIIHLIDADTKIRIDVKAGLKVTLFEFYYFLGNDPAIKIDFHAGENSSVNYVRFKHGDLAGEIRFITNTNIGENTYINNRNLSVLSSVCSLIDNVFLQSENAKIEMLNVTINTFGKTQYHQYDIHHRAPRTFSMMNNYGISKRRSVLDIKSNGIIAKGAKKASLTQKTKGLILGDDAHLAANPFLEIDEHDVIASHGASIGAINEDELYYLMSRGLTYANAEKLIVSGFINPFFNGLRDDKSIDYMKRKINQNL